MSTNELRIFISYSHKDEAFVRRIRQEVDPLQPGLCVESWFDRMIPLGTDWEDDIDRNLELADVVVLLLSPDFLASEYCYRREAARALERHEEGAALVVPVVLRVCRWMETPLAKLQAVPKDGKPVRSWRDQDEAFFELGRSIRASIAGFQRARLGRISQASRPGVRPHSSDGRVHGPPLSVAPQNPPFTAGWRAKLELTLAKLDFPGPADWDAGTLYYWNENGTTGTIPNPVPVAHRVVSIEDVNRLRLIRVVVFPRVDEHGVLQIFFRRDPYWGLVLPAFECEPADLERLSDSLQGEFGVHLKKAIATIDALHFLGAAVSFKIPPTRPHSEKGCYVFVFFVAAGSFGAPDVNDYRLAGWDCTFLTKADLEIGERSYESPNADVLHLIEVLSPGWARIARICPSTR